MQLFEVVAERVGPIEVFHGFVCEVGLGHGDFGLESSHDGGEFTDEGDLVGEDGALADAVDELE